MSRKIFVLLSLVLITAFALSACGPAATATQAVAPTAAVQATEAPQATVAPTEAAKVTINWWHISTKDPGMSLWQKMANEYMAAHPNVTINITVLENEAFKTKLTTVMQSGTPPDIFQSWGGGAMNAQIACRSARRTSPRTSMQMAAPGAIPSLLARWLSMPTRARTTACRGTWAWSVGGTTRICSPRPKLPTRPRPGPNSWRM